MHRPRAPQQSLACETCNTRLKGVFAELGRDALARIDQCKIIRGWRRGQTLFHEGSLCSSIFCIRSGLAKVSKYAPRNREHILYLARPGDVVGLESLLTGEIHISSAEMLQDGEVCQIEGRTFLSTLATNAALGPRVARVLADQLIHSQEERTELVSGEVGERLSLMLLALAGDYGESSEGGAVRLAVDFSREDLARMIGASPETTIRKLGELRESGIISTEGATLVLNDPERLARLARVVVRSSDGGDARDPRRARSEAVHREGRHDRTLRRPH